MSSPSQRACIPALLLFVTAACSGSGGSNAPGVANLVYAPDRFPANEPNADTYTFQLGTTIPALVPSVDGVVTSFTIAPPFAQDGGTLGYGNVVPQTGTILPDNAAPLTYAPPEYPGAPSTNERANVFLPLGTPPADGWPWIVATTMGGYKLEAPLDGLVPTPSTDNIAWMLHALVNQGFVVFATGFEGSPSTSSGLYTAPDDPSGRWGSDDGYRFQEKLARWMIQKAKTDWASDYGLNPLRGGCMGSSAGGSVWFASALGADRAAASGSAQERASTGLRFVIALRSSAWPLAFLASTPNGAGHYVDGASGFPNPATTIGGADPANVMAASNAWFLREPGSMAPTTALFLAHDETAGSLDFSTNAAGLPNLTNVFDPDALTHPVWSGGMLTTMLRRLDVESGTAFHTVNSEWWVGGGYQAELGPPQSGYVTGTFSADLLRNATVRDAVVAFALRHGDLPSNAGEGIGLDGGTGTIAGTPNALQPLTAHTITASGPAGSTTKTLFVRVTN